MSLTGMTKGSSLVGKISSLAKIHGYSAYEVAVINGFSGTEEEWLESLQGDFNVWCAEYGVSTYADIYNAFTAGKSVYCKNGYYVLPMTFYQNQSNTAKFSGTAGGEEVVWQVKTNEWSSEALVDEDKFVAEYGVSTYAEIYSAMQEGKSIFCKNGYYEFPMVKFTAPSWTACFGGMADGQNVTFKVQGETWSSYNAELNDDCVKTVNGIAPDENGNVEISVSGGTAVATVEPADDDMPKVFFVGTLPTAKSEGELKGSFEYISKTEHINGYCTLKVQGDTSTGYPKKNFTMKTYSDEACETKVKHDFKSWGKLNKFVLKAHWVDPSHIRNVGCAKLWGQMVRSRNDFSSLPVELQNSPNNGATDGFTVKFYANGIYQGMYEWIVPKDKLFGQDSDIATHSIMNSELNNSPTCAFATINPAITGNWSEELQDSMSSDISTSFANFIRFVAGSTDEEFVANAENYFDVQSVIDFDIFARVICAVDCICKNQIFFTYDGVKWYEGAWDLDLVLGNYAGTAYNTKFQQGYIPYKSHGIINMLYVRVEKLFETEFKQRYAELRKTVLTAGNIINIFERLSDVITAQAGLYAEDKASTTADGAFTTAGDGTGSIITIRNFIAKRLVYMDGSIADLNQLTVTYNLTNVSSDNTVEFVEVGSSYVANLTTEDGYTISEIVVKMGDVDVTETVYANGVITIDNVTDDVVITAVATNAASVKTYEFLPSIILDGYADGTGDPDGMYANGDAGRFYKHDIEVTAGQEIVFTYYATKINPSFIGNRYVYDARKFMNNAYKQVQMAEHGSEQTVTLTATASGTLVIGGFYNSAGGYESLDNEQSQSGFVGKYIRVTVTG